jgi:NADH-quinone oxidoreductase subunit M
MHTREIARYGGLVKNMPRYATVFMIFMLGSVGLPGTSGFIGEFLALMGAFQADTLVAVFATTGVVLGAAYMLVLYRKVIFGVHTNEEAASMKDLTRIEYYILVPLALLVLWFGVAPGFVMDRMAPSVERLINQYQQANSVMPDEVAALESAAVSTAQGEAVYE